MPDLPPIDENGKVEPDITVAQLRRLVAAAARGAELDGVRAQLIARAEQLGRGGLLPDNWRADGSLGDAADAWSGEEQRETWNDLYTGLSSALDEKYDGEYCWIWVQDFTDAEVIFAKGGDLLSAPYTVVAGGPIEIGDAVKVRPVTEYVKVSERAAATSLREWRRAKVEKASLKGIERRAFPARDLQLREAVDGALRLTGYACVTEHAYEVGWYRETIARGAFRRTLSESPDVQLLINHTGMPLARTTSGTLRLDERTTPDGDGRTGLWVEADLDPEDPDVKSLRGKMARGDIDEMSFAFQVTTPGGGWNEDYSERVITSCSLHRGDVSVVNYGANPATAATLRSQDAIAALRGLGADALTAALVEWRGHTLLPLAERAGRTLSAATMDLLSSVVELMASSADDAGEARTLLVELMGIEPPDDDAEEDDAPAERAIVIPDMTTRAQQRIASLTAGRR